MTDNLSKYFDCYIHNHMGLFIPNTGIHHIPDDIVHSDSSYIIIITFDNPSIEDLSNNKSLITIRNDQYLAAILSPGISNEEITGKFNHYYCLKIDKDYFEEQYLMYDRLIPVFNWKRFAICHDVLKSLNLFAFEYGKNMPNADITLNAQETILTHWMIRSLLGENYDMRTISSKYEIARAQHYIEQHYGEKITLAQLAALGSISVSALNRNFKKEVGLTPMEYLTQIRIQKAQKMLRRPERSVTDIAIQCGFGSSAHFSDVFGKLYGYTPSQYRSYYQND